MVTPEGEMVTRRLPGSGAGPSEERLVCGSEGTLGIITSAWMRLQNIPTFKKTITVAFKDFHQGAEAARQISQSGLNPANARLIDAIEAFNNGLGDGSSAILIIGFESHQRDVTHWMHEALAICKKAGGSWDESRLTSETRSAKGDAWKNSFLLAPYLRDHLMMRGLVVETFETAVTWDQFPTFYKEVKKAANEAIQEFCGAGIVTCRFTHIYPDGPAPYFTIIAKGSKDKQLDQWDAIKKKVSNTLIEYGGTITHHHAVGRDHQPYYKQQRSDIFSKMLSSAKTAVDPKWILNPGILFEKD
jgi:alkyldihydroxyacetonephosphate synthase